MASLATDTRIRYLDDISQTLFVSSPTVSAHVQSTRHALAESNDIALNDRGQICTACGSVLILGWSCKRISDPRRKQRRSGGRRLPSNESGARDLRVRCERCDAITTMSRTEPVRKIDKQAATAIVAPPKNVQQQSATQDAPTAPTKPTESTRTTSRKRTRNKTSTSLQSLLKASQAATKSSESDGFGLAFNDFMQP